MAPSPGACSTACSRRTGSTIDGDLRHLGRRDERRRAGLRLSPRAAREGARQALEAFWRRISEAARFSPFQRSPLDVLLGRWTLDNSPLFVAMDLMSRLVSPYDLNPRRQQPARRDPRGGHRFRAGSATAPIKLFITATNVRTGRGRVFRNARDHAGRAARLGLPADHVPGDRDRRRRLLGRRLFRQPDDDAADPRAATPSDTILVQINPVERPGTPRTRARHPQPAQRGLVQRACCSRNCG